MAENYKYLMGETEMDVQREFPFEFSVVMAVYNVEPFLREAVDSLIAQNFGFEKIQLIMVDDGSTDGSGAICDEYAERYPKNVMVIHKENGGVASARNEGLKYASGRYLNFMDSDDKFTRNAFLEVHRFFQKNEEETDVVTIPLEFFDGARGPHWQNEKFKKGSRVLDLFWDYKSTIMFVNASFFVNTLKEEIEFDPRLVCGEDIKVLLTVLTHKMKLGVVHKCKYMYRRRSAGEASLIQTAKKKYGWYFDYFTYLVDWVIEFYQDKFGYLPAFLQYELLCDLQWRFGEIYDMTPVLTEDEIEQYKIRLFESLRNFDDKYILEQRMIWDEHKCYMLSKKYDSQATLTERNSNVIVHFGNTKLKSVADQYSKIEFLRIEDGVLTVEGFSKVFGVQVDTEIQPYLQINNELFPCEIVNRESINEYRFAELMFRGIAFRISIPLDTDCEKYRIRFALKYGTSVVVRRDIRCGQFLPVSKEYGNAYYYKDGWAVQLKGNAFIISRCGRKKLFHYEYDFLKELWKKNKMGSRKAVLARLAYRILKKVKHKPLWLISDRIVKADDNGEAFFRYMQKEHRKKIKSVFVLSKDSVDYERMKKIGPVVDNLSWKHKMLFLLCDYNISSQADLITANPFPGYEGGVKDILSQERFVFLQHGVIINDISGWLNQYNKNFYGFITSANPEYASILTPNYSYSANQVWLTGLPRFDRLYHDEKKYITIMPTWRRYLMQGMDSRTGIWSLKPSFNESDFCCFYRNLLNHPKLISAAARLGYKLRFLPHPTLQPHLSVFEIGNDVEVLSFDMKYREMYAESDLVVTDYSSACYDFSYLRKPIIYCQFDKEVFFSGEHVCATGYFDYERDGFGEVERDLEGTVNRIIEYMENGCQLKQKYRERIDKFFAFNDQNNCQRVYEAIMGLERRRFD